MEEGSILVTSRDASIPGWLRYVKSVDKEELQNLTVVEAGKHFFFEVTRDIEVGVEYGLMGRRLDPDSDPAKKDPPPPTPPQQASSSIPHRRPGRPRKSEAAAAKMTPVLSIDEVEGEGSSEMVAAAQEDDGMRKSRHSRKRKRFDEEEGDSDEDEDDPDYRAGRVSECTVGRGGGEGASASLPFKCEVCTCSFPTQSWLEAHQHKHESANQVVFVCKFCDEAFRFITAYEKHLEEGHPELDKKKKSMAEKFRCDECHKSFRSFQMLERHERAQSETYEDGKDRLRLKCPYCDKMLMPSHLESHVIRAHPGNNPYACTFSECQLRFKTKEERGNHMKEVHEVEPNQLFKCPFNNCSKTYASEATMTYHYQRVHTTERPFICEVCGKGWVKLAKLKEHMITHKTVKNELCDVCGRAFKTRPELRDHKIELHTEKGREKLRCRFCPATFSRRSSRSYHERRHKGEAPYACPKPGCNKKFVAVIDYKRHLIYHTGAKLYRCRICNNSFTRSDYLKGHEKKHHEKGEMETGPPVEETVTIKVPWPMEKAVKISGQNVKVVIEPDPSLNDPESVMSLEALAGTSMEGGVGVEGIPTQVQVIDQGGGATSEQMAASILQQVGGSQAVQDMADGSIVQVVTSSGQPITAVIQQAGGQAHHQLSQFITAEQLASAQGGTATLDGQQLVQLDSTKVYVDERGEPVTQYIIHDPGAAAAVTQTGEEGQATYITVTEIPTAHQEEGGAGGEEQQTAEEYVGGEAGEYAEQESVIKEGQEELQPATQEGEEVAMVE